MYSFLGTTENIVPQGFMRKISIEKLLQKSLNGTICQVKFYIISCENCTMHFCNLGIKK